MSVDAKKKERVGAFKNAGRQWSAKGKPLVSFEAVTHSNSPHLQTIARMGEASVCSRSKGRPAKE